MAFRSVGTNLSRPYTDGVSGLAEDLKALKSAGPDFVEVWPQCLGVILGGSLDANRLRTVGELLLEAEDMNPGMLEVAARKLAWTGDRITFHSSRIDELPIDDATVDGVMINQVLHHLPDDASEGFPAHRLAFQEFARVLKPGGILTVGTCSQEQLRHGYWHYHLIPEAADTLRNRYAPLDELLEILDDCGFTHRGSFAPIDATVQGESYFDPRGPLSKEWRDGDSVWSLVAGERLERALSRLRKLDQRGELETYVARNDALRSHIGQATIVYASRR